MLMLIALELTVVDLDTPLFVCMWSWLLLVRIWVVLRFNDVLGWSPADTRMGKSGLTGKLRKNKTTGPGKKIRVLPVFITSVVFVAVKHWLANGYAM